MQKRNSYTVEPGRNIYRDGKPFVCIDKQGDTKPTEADSLTHIICFLLNKEQPDLSD